MTVNNPETITRPDVFSRGALELTFKLLRKNNPRLSLEIQNQLQGVRATLHDNELSHRAQPSSLTPSDLDHFKITLDASTIGKVVDALTHMGQQLLDSAEKDSGTLVVIRSLMNDWIELAEWILLHTEDSPSQAWH
ncbi:MAG: hypothetical protein ACRBBW_04110 [Cellvibrionaceae bacterium]